MREIEKLTIAMVPFTGQEVLDVSSVMAATQSTEVVVDGEKIVLQALSILRTLHSTVQVQILKREFDQGVKLASEATGLGKTLELDDQNVGSLPQLELLVGLHMFLATRAVPSISTGKNFLFAELIQTLIESDTSSLQLRLLLTLGDGLRVRENLDVVVGRLASKLVVTLVAAEQGIEAFICPIQHYAIALTKDRLFLCGFHIRSIGIAVIITVVFC
jgi:hypothetical protein